MELYVWAHRDGGVHAGYWEIQEMSYDDLMELVLVLNERIGEANRQAKSKD